MAFSSDLSRFDPHELTAERIRHLYRRRASGLWTNAVSGAFLGILLKPVVGIWALVAWYALFLCAHASQWHLGRLRGGGERLVSPMSSLRSHRLAAWLAGSSWGVVGVILPWLPADLAPAAVVLIVLATVISMPRMAAMPDIFLSFAVGALLPVCVAAFWTPWAQRRMVWIVVGLVSAVMWVSARAVEADLMEVVVKRLELERMAWEDKLTGLANRRRFDAVLAEEWRRATRMGTPISLLLMDVDHFKLFNDTYGHPSGDACLTLVGGVLSNTIRRAGDFVARYGGEEFVVLLFHASRADALQMAERMRAAVQGLRVDHRASLHGVVTLSIGGATIVPRAEQAPQYLLDQADEALYQAKEAGRNRVVWSAVLA